MDRHDRETEFRRQPGGVYDGMPLFDGDPAHLDAYVDALFAYTGPEGPAVYATGTRNVYTLTRGPNAGRRIPGALSAADNVQGVSTDFPSMLALGQSWDRELLARVGGVIGAEKISTLSTRQGTANLHNASNDETDDSSRTVAFTVVSDLRNNPLSGRFDENFSEDPYLTGTLVSDMANGICGIGDPVRSRNGFWVRTVVGTKHFSVYQAQWYRTSASNYAGARAIFEYHVRAPLKALRTGAVSGVMSSYGRTNGVPNIMSPYIRLADRYARYGLYSSPDWAADAHLSGEGMLGNGIDASYVPDRTHGTVLQLLARSNAGRPMAPDPSDVPALVDAVAAGMYGVTEEDLVAAARGHVNALVRAGVFNEADSDGIVVRYPYVAESRDRAPLRCDYRDPAHQEVAREAARESIVLLKNENRTLPLRRDARMQVCGVYANARFKTQYSVALTPGRDEVRCSGFTPLQGILDTVSTPGHVRYDAGTAVIALRAQANARYIRAPAGEGGTLRADAPGGASAASDDADVLTEEHLFEVYDWGQGGYSLMAQSNHRWVSCHDTDFRGWGPTPLAPTLANNDPRLLAIHDNTWGNDDLFGSSSSLPSVFRDVRYSDGSVAILANAFSTDFTTNFTTALYRSGRFVTVGSEGELRPAEEPVGDAAGLATPAIAQRFTATSVKRVGADAGIWAESDAECAIVFVGANVKHSASEGKDRSTLAMADSDYALVREVAARFRAAGKRTVVVVETNFPVIMASIHEDPNVDAIVYQPYGGQYDGKALAEVLFGESPPTGRLTSSWYADMDAIPDLDRFSVPEGSGVRLSSLDPRFTKDMTNADPIAARLTYRYTDAAVTYPFGYGLSYSAFEYGEARAPRCVGASPFAVATNVRNTGPVRTATVVQLYAANRDSAYGAAAGRLQLVGFERVVLDPGEERPVVIRVDPEDLEIWDVNRGDYLLERGRYRLMLGSSSRDIHAETEVVVEGEALAELDPGTPFNVFDHSFASSEALAWEVSKRRTAEALRLGRITGGYHALGSRRAGAWAALAGVDLTGVRRAVARVASAGETGAITLHADSPDAKAFASFTVSAAGVETVPVDGLPGGATTGTLAYVEAIAAVDWKPEGVHDVYVVFGAPDLRIDSLQLLA